MITRVAARVPEPRFSSGSRRGRRRLQRSAPSPAVTRILLQSSVGFRQAAAMATHCPFVAQGEVSERSPNAGACIGIKFFGTTAPGDCLARGALVRTGVVLTSPWSPTRSSAVCQLVGERNRAVVAIDGRGC